MGNTSHWLYRTLVHGAVPVAVPWLWVQQLLTGKRRPPFRQRCARALPALTPAGCWIQAVSVGEVEIARRLVAELRRQCPTLPLLLTATTATGLALARRTLPATLPVLPCPLDLPGPTRRMLHGARPRVLTLVETELWPELLHQAQRHQVPVAVVNARLSPTSYARYRRLGRLLPPLLAPLSLVLARSEEDRHRFVLLGVPEDRVRVSGNIKYDLEPDAEPLTWTSTVRALAGDRVVVVAGSTMEGEEAAVVEAVAALNRDGPRVFLVLAPRHPERFDAVAGLLEHHGLVVCRRSALPQTPPTSDVFLLDTIGELGRAYALAQMAFVGGSFVPTGGHNPLEPAVWGVPVLSGPHVHNFDDVYSELTTAGAARIVPHPRDLATAMADWLEGSAARTAGSAGSTVISHNRGAARQTAAALCTLAQRSV